MKTKNSCGSQGCNVRIILPHDRRVSDVSTRVLSGANDTKTVLFIPSLLVEKKAA